MSATHTEPPSAVTPYGHMNWPSAEPSLPQAAANPPFRSNFTMRWLSLSVTYAPVASTAMPCGWSSCPGPPPVDPVTPSPSQPVSGTPLVSKRQTVSARVVTYTLPAETAIFCGFCEPGIVHPPTRPPARSNLWTLALFWSAT